MLDRSRLRQFMTESFNDDELADLIFDYFPNVRTLLGEGMTLGQKVRILIDFADRHGRTDHLIVVLEKQRPDAYCEFFQTDLALPPEPETAARNPHQVFISYAGPDAAFAAQLAADLREQAVPVWLAPDSIQPGEKWVAAIERGLRESGIFLLVLSPDGMDSKWVSQETQVAIMLENEGKMRVYPLRVRRAEVPLLLSTRQHISFEKSYDAGLAALLAVLQPGSSQPAPAPSKPAPRSLTETLLVDDVAFPVLIIDWPDQPNQEVTLSRMATTVGRAPDNDIVLNLPVVSSHHLRLETVDEGDRYRVSVIDLGSRNGTFLSGRRLPLNTPHPLEPGDVIHLGDRIGRSISLILRPGVAGAAVQEQHPAADFQPQPEIAPIAAAAVAGAGPITQPAPAGRPPTTNDQPQSPAATSPLSKIPMWAYAAAGLVLLALVLLFALRGRGDRPESPAAASTGETTPAVVVAAATVATDDEPQATAEAIVAPTSAPTEATAPTSIPTETTAPTTEPTQAPTEAATTAPAETVAPTAEAATPTAEPVALPTEVANFEISRATPLSFEALGEWLRDNANSRSDGTMTISNEQAHSGSYAVRLGYDFPTSGDDYVAFAATRPYRIANDRERRFLKVWALGDGRRMNLSAIVTDREGEFWKVFLGEISGTEWVQLDGYIGDATWPSGVIGAQMSGEVEFPVRLRGFLLDDADPSVSGTGAVFLDDVTVE